MAPMVRPLPPVDITIVSQGISRLLAIKLNIITPYFFNWTYVDTEPQTLDGNRERLTPFSEVDQPGKAEYGYNGKQTEKRY